MVYLLIVLSIMVLMYLLFKLKCDYSKIYDEFKIIKDPYFLEIKHCNVWNIWCTSQSKKINIGCKRKTIEGWDYFFSEESKEEFSTERNSPKWKKIKRKYEFFREYLITNKIVEL